MKSKKADNYISEERRLNYRSSIVDYFKIIQLNPEWKDFYNKIDGLVNLEKADYELIIDLSTSAIQNNPSDSMMHFARAKARAEVGQTDEANADFQKAIELDPENPKIYYDIAEFKYDQFSNEGHVTGYCIRAIAELLISALEKAIKSNEIKLIKEIKSFLEGYIYYELDLDKLENSDAYSLDRLEENFNYDDLCKRNEYQIIMQKNVRDIIIDLTRLTEICPDWDFPFFEKGWYQISVTGDYLGAIESCTKVIELVNHNKASHANSAYYNRGEAKFKLGDLEGARSDYEIAIGLNPNEGAYYDQL